ncbi:hypothetical protein COHA_003608 [Chlorella ohadii]|uniref:Uncharacterized protein n=1 Tax=Chlorella ohadii TaxID=2649997 RepID=A0AAD5H7S1_9CHLO|nr:hypothetical protein COHA_003608 [Chlorella ohadii]
MCAPRAGISTQQVVRLDDGTVLQAQEFKGPPRLQALPYLFTDTRVEVHCPGHMDYRVFTGGSMEEVRAAYTRGEHAWCGLARMLHGSPNCTVAARPHGSTFVAIAKPKTWLGSDEGRACQMSRTETFSMARLLAAAVGGFLFWNAAPLSTSTPFRLTGGTLGFMALSSLIVLLYLYRRVPHKGKLLAGTAVFGSSFLATMRWLFGVWLPSAHQVLHHPLTLSYLGLSGLTGLALTYYYNNTENRKINTMLRVALQLVGLGAVYLSGTTPEASTALCAGLLGAKVLYHLRRYRSLRSAFDSAKADVKQLASDERELPLPAAGGEAERPARGAAGQPAAPSAAAQQLDRTPAVGTGRQQAAVPEVSPLIQRGLILNEETGHIIGIGKATYIRLVESGYVVDQIAGTITPPPPSPDSPARGGRARGSGRRRRS